MEASKKRSLPVKPEETKAWLMPLNAKL
jgi:hypothetical protein